MMVMMMKNPVILVACTLLFSSLAVLGSPSSFCPQECCFKFISKMVPKKNVVDYKYTDSLCPMPGVLFKMKSGSVICTDPSVEWVKNFIEAKEKVRAKNVKNTEPKESE